MRAAFVLRPIILHATASGGAGSVSGGRFNEASGTWSSVSGGFLKEASGADSHPDTHDTRRVAEVRRYITAGVRAARAEFEGE